jgi:phage replication-related protein YjqB (UPF0714/DUF867 family)
MKEQWKRISTHPDYEVSDQGRIRRGERYIAITMNAHGYQKCNLGGNDSQRRTQIVHRLVAKAFLPNPQKHPVVHHKDANKVNNHAKNLEWCSHSQNSRYAAETRFAENNGKPARPHPTFRELMEELGEIKLMLDRLEERCFDD